MSLATARPVMRRCASLFALAVLLLVPSMAFAQMATINTIVRNGSPRAAEQSGGVVSSMLPIGLRDCPCETWTITGSFSGTAASANPRLEFWVGTSNVACSTLTNRANSGTTVPSCWQIPTEIVPTQPIQPSFTVVIPSVLLVNPLDRQCVPLPAHSNSGSVWLSILAFGADDMTPMTTQEIPYNFDTSEAPNTVTATAQEGAALVQWTIGTTSTDEAGTAVLSPTLNGFYVLCFPGPPASFDAGVRDACTPINVGDAGPIDTGIADLGVVDVTDIGTTDIIGTDATSDIVSIADGSTDAGVTCSQAVVPADFDPNDDNQFNRYRCSDLRARTETMFTVQGLSNGQAYRFGVVAQDTAGNRSVVVSTAACVTPQPVTDFWEHYHGQGGRAQPGFCAVRPGPVGWKSVVPLAFGAVALIAWRRRRAKKNASARIDDRGDA